MAIKTVTKYGRNEDVDVTVGGVTEDIVIAGGLQWWSAVTIAAGSIDVVSTSADDTVGGTGVHAIELTGIRDDYTEGKERLNLTGVTTVHPVYGYRAIHRIECLGVGSGGVNAGIITIKSGANIMAEIATGDGQTLQAAWTIPAGFKKGTIRQLDVHVLPAGGSVWVEGVLQIRSGADQCWLTKKHWVANEAVAAEEELHITVYPKTEIRVTATDAGSASLVVVASFTVELEGYNGHENE